MFKTNTGREIFYIFLWLAGIILLYSLVEIYILEPSHFGHKAKTQEKQSLVNTSSTDNTRESVSQKRIMPVVKTVTHQSIKATKRITPVVLTKVIDKAEKTLQSPREQKSIKSIKSTEKNLSINTKVSKATVSIVQNKETKSTDKEATQIVSTPSAVSIPSTPSIPSVPSVPSVPQKVSVKTMQTPTHTLHTESEALKKELSSDEKMKLVESARQLVIDKAEAARTESIEAPQ